MIVRNGHAVISMLQFAKKTKAYKRIVIQSHYDQAGAGDFDVSD